MSKALEGVRILDLTSGPAGGIATMILADFGAEVLTIAPPEDGSLAELPAAPMWGRGKRLLRLDLTSQAEIEKLHGLCAGADVLVCNWRNNALVKKGLDWTSLHSTHKHLVFCHITGFGNRGPLADCPGYEHVVAAYAGRMMSFSGLVDRLGPVFSAVQVGVHATAHAATAGILAALFERGDNGEGRLVETSILQGMQPYDLAGLIGSQFERFSVFFTRPPGAGNEPPMPSLYYHPAQAADGRWMQFGNLLPHLFDQFLIVTELADVLADPDYDQAQMMLPDQKHEAFRDRMLARIQARDAADWMEDIIQDGGVVATAYQTTQQALDDPDIVANGHVISRQDGGVQLGPVARLTKTPAMPGGDIEADDGIADLWQETPRSAPTTSLSGKLPLAGVKIVEIATIIAAPLGASFLADLGAEVIKVEQIGGDPFRSLLAGVGSAKVNAGKRSISVNLKSDAGREIVQKLISDADVVIHNFRPGVPERLGIGYEQVSENNPGLVYLQSNGYGPDGPGALRPSTHPIPGAAMGGVMHQMGERVPTDLQDNEGLRLWTRRLMHANEVNPDPNTAVVVATSVMLGLAARKINGIGQQILIDMFGANAYANHDDFLRYPGKRPRALPDEQLLGLSATYRLYPCKQDQWVFLAVTNHRERERFIGALDGAGIEGPTETLLADGGEPAEAVLSALFAGQDADYWEQLLVPAGVACVRANRNTPGQFWLHDEQVKSMQLTAQVEHPQWGAYLRHGPMVLFDDARHQLGTPPTAGQHNEEVLRGQGYSAEEVASMIDEGVLWREVAPE
jgi:crotonobetainyl-CoA:carnitine CoA-transferase CaiB-like acyl-CoA transferase